MLSKFCGVLNPAWRSLIKVRSKTIFDPLCCTRTAPFFERKQERGWRWRRVHRRSQAEMDHLFQHRRFQPARALRWINSRCARTTIFCRATARPVYSRNFRDQGNCPSPRNRGSKGEIPNESFSADRCCCSLRIGDNAHAAGRCDAYVTASSHHCTSRRRYHRRWRPRSRKN